MTICPMAMFSNNLMHHHEMLHAVCHIRFAYVGSQRQDTCLIHGNPQLGTACSTWQCCKCSTYVNAGHVSDLLCKSGHPGLDENKILLLLFEDTLVFAVYSRELALVEWAAAPESLAALFKAIEKPARKSAGRLKAPSESMCTCVRNTWPANTSEGPNCFSKQDVHTEDCAQLTMLFLKSCNTGTKNFFTHWLLGLVASIKIVALFNSICKKLA